MIARLLDRLAAKRLSKLSIDKQHKRIIERTKQMRAELGLPEDRRLA